MTISEERPLLAPNDCDVIAARESRVTSALRLINWNAHPYWIIPIVFAVNMSRGVTTAPKIQVYKAIACRALYGVSPNLNAHSPEFQMFQACSGTDVAVRAAGIQAVVVTTTSILSAVSTGFWSRFSDSYGRKPIFVLFLIGFIFMEFVCVLIMRPKTIFSLYGEQFILFGPIMEGLSGGLWTFFGLLHAYISDCTRDGSRSTIFSTIHGIVFVGLSAGPWFTGMVLPPGASTDAFFYISMTISAMTLIYVLVLLPESRKRATDVDLSHRTNEPLIKTSSLVVLRGYFTKFLTALLSPIVMFAPRPIKGHPQKKTYILTFLGLGTFIHGISGGLDIIGPVFALHLYGWSAIQLGYYMSLLWIIKAVNLLVILPTLISYFKPKTRAAPGTSLNPRELVAELRFDRQLTQASLISESAIDLLVASASRNSQIFTVLSCANSFTSGVNPVLHSLAAISLHASGYSSDVGALFGAKAVLSTISYVISPTIFAATYAATVAYFPQAIFVLAAVLTFVSVVLISGIRPPLGEIELVCDTTPEGSLRPSEERP